MKIKKYGWIPDLPDQRDHIFAAPQVIVPSRIDLRHLCPPVLDQGQLGSCTANAIANAHRFDQNRQKLPGKFPPSRLFIYYNERAMEGTINSDAGASIRDGIKSINILGVCPESLWPYNIAKFTNRPSAAAFKEALRYKSVSYSSVIQSASQMKGCLAAGYPFVVGFTVYESFESDAVAKTGQVPMPGSSEQVLGGHATLVVGYDDSSQTFIVMNSWSISWGDKGFFYMPYAYLTSIDLASDFWTIRTIA